MLGVKILSFFDRSPTWRKTFDAVPKVFPGAPMAQRHGSDIPSTGWDRLTRFPSGSTSFGVSGLGGAPCGIFYRISPTPDQNLLRFNTTLYTKGAGEDSPHPPFLFRHSCHRWGDLTMSFSFPPNCWSWHCWAPLLSRPADYHHRRDDRAARGSTCITRADPG